MSQLKDANIQEILSHLRKFHDAVKVAETDTALKEKKERAGAAMDHLESLLSARPREAGNDEAGYDCSGCTQQATGGSCSNNAGSATGK